MLPGFAVAHTMISLRLWSPRTIVLAILLLAILITAFSAHRSRPSLAFFTSWATKAVVDGSMFEHTSIPSAVQHTELGQARLLDPDEASKVCNQRRWAPWPNRQTHRKVYDLMLINTELDWSEIRMAELDNEVDYFVVVPPASFTNLSKLLHLQDNWARYAGWHCKMIYHLLNATDMVAENAWDRERFQRNSMYDQVFPFLQGEKEHDSTITASSGCSAMAKNGRLRRSRTISARTLFDHPLSEMEGVAILSWSTVEGTVAHVCPS